MKTAEEKALTKSRFVWLLIEEAQEKNPFEAHNIGVDHIKNAMLEFRIDAIVEGMRRAAKIATKDWGSNVMQQDILSAAEQLEKESKV